MSPQSEKRIENSALANYDAERGLLGSVLLVSNAFDLTLPICRGAAFSDDSMGLAYDVAAEMYESGIGVDVVTVADRLDRARPTPGDYWSGLLIEVLGSVPHAAHARYYAETVARHYQRRLMLDILSELTRDTMDERFDNPTLLGRGIDRFHKLECNTNTGLPSLMTGSLQFLAELEEDDTYGIQTHYHDLDQLIFGLKPKQLVILAARPSCGKTALACNLIDKIATRGTPILFASLEQSSRELIERLALIRTGIDSRDLQRRPVRGDHASAIAEAVSQINQLPVVIDDATPMTVSDIAAKARLMRAKMGLGLIVVDYLQIIQASNYRDTREQQVSQISKDLKEVAKQLEVPILALAQLGRMVDKRHNNRPMLSDLRESGAIEQNADIVMFLHQPWKYDEDADKNTAELIVAKHRSGPTGDVKLKTNPESFQFTESAPPFEWASVDTFDAFA